MIFAISQNSDNAVLVPVDNFLVATFSTKSLVGAIPKDIFEVEVMGDLGKIGNFVVGTSIAVASLHSLNSLDALEE